MLTTCQNALGSFTQSMPLPSSRPVTSLTMLSLSPACTCTNSALAMHCIPASVRPARCKIVRMNPGGHAMSYLDTITGNTNKGNKSNEGNTKSLCYLFYLPLLQGLSHSGKDNFLAALMRIPHGLRTMYVHAYQSYLWNAATSERCLKHGTKSVVQGDLVLPVNSAEAEEESHANGEQSLPLVQRQRVHCTQAAARVRHASRSQPLLLGRATLS